MTSRSLWDSRRQFRWGVLALVFVLAVLPRTLYPVSRPMQWYYRAVRFGDAVLSQDWAGTYQRYHPGVTTMWLSGVGLKVFAAQQGLTSDQLLGLEPTKPGILDDAVTAGVVPLALAISLCIVLATYLTTRISGPAIGIVAGCLLALDPFYITYSKVLHVDALLGSLLLVSALGLLLYLANQRRSSLILSAVFGGLAFLSKSSSLFLLPYAALVLGFSSLPREDWRSWRAWLTWSKELAAVLATWCAVAALIFVALWPAMWVEPLAVLQKIGEWIFFHVETPHYNPVFFGGQITFEDPGLMFYPATIVWKTTLVTLPMICAALILAMLRARVSKAGLLVWSLVAYTVFFTIQMGFSAYKQLAYLLPVFPALDLVAAIGLVGMAKVLGRACPRATWRFSSTVLVVMLVGLQVLVALSRHPYYGTHHNRLLGGSQVAREILPMQEQAEGLDLAAKFLSGQPRAQRARVAVQQRGATLFRRSFIGLTTSFQDPQQDYRVYTVNQVMRGLDIEDWGDQWDRDRQTEPLWRVDFDGVTYVWIYGKAPEEPAAGGLTFDADFRLGEHILLQGGRLSTDVLAPGKELTVVLLWKSDGKMERNYKVFCHLLSVEGEIAAQRDGVPLSGIRPTPGWRADEIIEDSYVITLGDDLAPGEYKLAVGMYDPETMTRLPITDAGADLLPDDTALIGWISIVASVRSGD